VIRQIGFGGMGAVYEVEHALTKHRRALKLLHAEMAAIPAIVTRFLREASAAGHIGNPHVVETFDAGQLDGGEPYIVMELLEGKTLAELLEHSKALGLLETCEILTQACDGVAAAHQRGIVHRDLKPENLFLLKGARPFVKILDFGISKFDPALTGAQGITLDGSTLGTPFYMPPEQVRGEKSIDAQADIYSLGVILYECLAGARPFEADTLPHLAVLIAEGKYVPPRVKRPELPSDVDAVVARAMASDRAYRYRSVDELRAALAALTNTGARTGPASMNFGETLVAGSPGSAPPPPVAGAVPQQATAAVSWSQPAPQSSDAKAPAHTAAPFSRTTGEPAKKPRSYVGVIAALALLVAGIALGSVLLRKGESTEAVPSATESSKATAAATPSATPVPTPTPTPPPTPEPTQVAPAPAPSTSVPAPKSRPAGSTEPARPQGHPQKGSASSRAKEHGLSEENPF
jgi:serine/threonine protein kinase